MGYAALYWPMPRFYTNIDNGSGFQRDEEGGNFRDLQAAHARAIVSGADIIAEELKNGCPTVKVTLTIEDTRRSVVDTISMMGTICR